MADLAHVLRRIPAIHDARLLAGLSPVEDAAVFLLREDLALVQTVDFFTPIVDDPYTFGQIAVANSLSDVYAVGGEPLTALNVACFPTKTLPLELLTQILRGGSDKATEAGVLIVGGHTVDDDEPKYGLAVTGTVDPAAMMGPHGARPGDVLVLTKPIGTGVITTALKSGRASPHHVAQAVRWMTTLNRGASRAMLAAQAHAATDITGFGLLGHLVQLCQASGVDATIAAEAVPLLPGAVDYAREGHVPSGTRANLLAVQDIVTFGDGLDEAVVTLLADAQTSGGLLVALSPDSVSSFEAHGQQDMVTDVIGRITSGSGQITVLTDSLPNH
jgi:selenide, water dikinase